MNLVIHKTARFDKQVEALRKADKKGSLAAAKAQLLIENLACMETRAPEVQTKRTKNGELRFRNCQKYDLGSGYRLVCAKEGARFYLLFIGSHDDCDRWLNNHRGVRLALDTGQETICYTGEGEAQLISPPPSERLEEPALDEYEQELLAKIDERTLRQIFRGICKVG